jgi:hypothetical protein
MTNYGVKEISLNHGNICGNRTHKKTGGSHIGLKELDQHFPHYELVMTLVKICDQSCDHSVAWEMLVQFFWAMECISSLIYIRGKGNSCVEQPIRELLCVLSPQIFPQF